jgi:hypothetical protein
MKNIKTEEFKLPTPEPLFKEFEQASRYPVESFGKYAEVLEAIEDMTQAPIAFAGQSFLSIASLCVQDIANVQTISGGYSPLSLYLLTLGKSGERKSSCDKLLMKSIMDLQHELSKETTKKTEAYKIAKEVWKNKHDSIMKDPSINNSTEKKLQELGAEPSEPIEHLLTISDPTTEGIFDLLDRGRPSIGLMTDEGGKILGGYGMNKENRMKSISIYSNFWDGNPANQVRRTSKSKTLYGKRLAMHILVQPEIAQDLFCDGLSQHQGFLPRMLITYPESKIGTRLYKKAKPESHKVISEVSKSIVQHLQRLSDIECNEDYELVFSDLDLSEEAHEKLCEFHDNIELEQLKGGKYYDIIAYASKACEQVSRIAGVFTLFEDATATIVNAEIIERAINLVSYHLDETLRITQSIIVPDYLLKADKLRLWLLEEYQEQYINPRTIVQFAKGNYKTTTEARKAIDLLAKHGWLIKSELPQTIGGHKSKDAWLINRI